ncbi:unnamed protein product [Pseudo-nitzschia multistriata]|uniref:RNA helicase n=1 Tax=Pseudo-nitzschia multistriata TaxID=183589 RepID=A0A448YWV2_9STRA|nr:unnamed protein product [Pseudo-nitzschia multistriata]
MASARPARLKTCTTAHTDRHRGRPVPTPLPAAMATRSAFGWSCRNCTFFHSVPAPRCSMCGELRGASRREMHDFVLGKRVAPVAEGNVVELPENDEGERGAGGTNRNGNGNTDGGGASFSKENRHNHRAPTPLPRTTGISAAAAAAASRNPYSKHPKPVRAAAAAAATTTATATTTAARTKNATNHPFVTTRKPRNTKNASVRNPYSTGRSMTNKGHQQKQQQQQQQQQQMSDAAMDSTDSNAQAPQRLPNPQPEKPPPPRPGPQKQTHVRPHSFFDKNPSSHASKRRKGQQQQQPKVHHFGFSDGPVPHNPDAALTYIYPKHPDFPTRDYQLEITETALRYNTLVSLPTGLGKTHIAAVVMYNFWRWFAPPGASLQGRNHGGASCRGGKVVFLAPTLPLVNQQIEACYNIMGIPGHETAVLTGRLKAHERRELWRTKRVFYCTPQTVQKDLVSACGGGSGEKNERGNGQNHDPNGGTVGVDHETALAFSRVVCLVLDEAHKATGDYAYTKVIELLEKHAGAKFRILGLSATPGTSIKAIQGVIEALRSCKIEARTDADPGVAPYLHEKRTEIVVCPRNTHQRDIGRRLSHIVEPLLKRLKDEKLFSYGTPETLTPYAVFRAKQQYETNFRGRTNGGILSCFHATHALIQIKNDCHQGLGVVRTKLLRLKSGPQRGILSTIVKSDDFGALFEKVMEATGGGPDGSNSNSNSNNNAFAVGSVVDPKLSKLCELLKVHFERSNAENHSSRAIVFAQFRDSVQEIVGCLEQTLKPLVRSRYFVGQNKGGGGGTGQSKQQQQQTTTTTTTGNDKVSGMKQAEQQKAIRDFRNNVFNVLVCTSIGEEGLDIGDVDLIINYDVIRSPIRTIQRAGRTGRKRDGRVVSLIAEGPEEQTHKKRVEGERTLANALKNPKKFVMASHYPMLPGHGSHHQAGPALEYQAMQPKARLNMKEVAGAQLTTPGSKKAAAETKRNAWRLTLEQEDERRHFMGGGNGSDAIACLPDAVAWKKLKRFFLRNRADPSRLPPSLFYRGKGKRLVPHEKEHLLQRRKELRNRLVQKRAHLFRGRNASILEQIQQKHGPVYLVGAAAAKRGHEAILELFPVHQVRDVESDTINKAGGTGPGSGIRKNMWPKTKTDQGGPATTSPGVANRNARASELPNTTVDETRQGSEASVVDGNDATGAPFSGADSLAKESLNGRGDAPPAISRQRPPLNEGAEPGKESLYRSSISMSEKHRRSSGNASGSTTHDIENAGALTGGKKLTDSKRNQVPMSLQPPVPQNSRSKAEVDEYVDRESENTSTLQGGKKVADSESDPVPLSPQPERALFRLPTPPPTSDSSRSDFPRLSENLEKAVFRLPTPPPSSDSSSGEDEDEGRSQTVCETNHPTTSSGVAVNNEFEFEENKNASGGIPQQIAIQAAEESDNLRTTASDTKPVQEESDNDERGGDPRFSQSNAAGLDTKPEIKAIFRLPTPPPSSSSSSDEDDESNDDTEVELLPQSGTIEGRFSHAAPLVKASTFHEEDMNRGEEEVQNPIDNLDHNDHTMINLEDKKFRKLRLPARKGQLGGSSPYCEQEKLVSGVSSDKDLALSSLKPKPSVAKEDKALTLSSVEKGNHFLGFEGDDDVALSTLKKSSITKTMSRNDGYHMDGTACGKDITSDSPLKILEGITLKTSQNDVSLSSLRKKNERKNPAVENNVSSGKNRYVEGERFRNDSEQNKKKRKKDAGDDTDSDEDVPLTYFKKTRERSHDAEKSKKDSPDILDTPCDRHDGSDKSHNQNSTVAKSERCIRPRLLETPEGSATDSLKESSVPTQSPSQQEIVNHLKSGKNRKRLRIGTDDSDEENGEEERLVTGLSYQTMTPSSSSVNNSTLRTVEDTPKTASDPISRFLRDTPNNADASAFLTDTPATKNGDIATEIVCQICTSGDTTDKDPIVLCDGCNLGFHKLCYRAEVDVESADPWFCDACKHPSRCLSSTTCTFCCQHNGILRKDGATFCHPLCLALSCKMTSANCSVCSLFGAVQCNLCSDAAHPHCALDSGWTIVHCAATKGQPMKHSMFCPKHSGNADQLSSENTRIIRSKKKTNMNGSQRPKKLKRKGKNTYERERTQSEKVFGTNNFREQEIEILDDTDDDEEIKKKEKESLKERRRRGLARFVLDEAEIGSDQDHDDEIENEELRLLEEEEGTGSQDSFINDNPDLTQHFSQDVLGDVDPDAASTDFVYGACKNRDENDSGGSSNIHRALDARREREHQFRTPNFNRRSMRAPDSSSPSYTENGCSIPSSERGLGRMHFIRSVLEHHRQGGDCDEIESEYKRLEASAGADVDATLSQIRSESTPANDRNALIDLSRSQTNGTDSPIQLMTDGLRPAISNGEVNPIRSSVERLNASSTRGASLCFLGSATDTKTTEAPPSQQFHSPGRVNGTATTLTAEQLARIEANRQAALRRRAQFQANQKA